MRERQSYIEKIQRQRHRDRDRETEKEIEPTVISLPVSPTPSSFHLKVKGFVSAPRQFTGLDPILTKQKSTCIQQPSPATAILIYEKVFLKLR